MQLKAGFLRLLWLLLLCAGVLSTPAFRVAQDPKDIDVAAYTGSEIIIGTEGGIVPLRNETIILRTGQVYYHNNVIPGYKYLKTLSKKQTRKVFRLARNPALPRKGFNHPGNMSTFLQLNRKQKPIRNFVWGEPGIEVPASLDKTYSGIINIIK